MCVDIVVIIDQWKGRSRVLNGLKREGIRRGKLRVAYFTLLLYIGAKGKEVTYILVLHCYI